MIDDLSEFWISIKSVLRLTVYDEMTNSFADVRAWSVVYDTISGISANMVLQAVLR